MCNIEYMVLGPTGNRQFLGSPWPRRPGKPFQMGRHKGVPDQRRPDPKHRPIPGFRAGFLPDSNRESYEIGPPAGQYRANRGPIRGV